MREHVILIIIPKQVEEREVIGNRQCLFIKGKSCLTSMVAFYNVMSKWVDEVRVLDVVNLDMSVAFDNVCHIILLGKLRKCDIDKWTLRWI